MSSKIYKLQAFTFFFKYVHQNIASVTHSMVCEDRQSEATAKINAEFNIFETHKQFICTGFKPLILA